eukprot:scaffold12613_cov38-Prasinocladus_malaysianus.AAC.1
MQGARLLEDSDPDTCVKLSLEAIDMLEEQQHDKLSGAKSPDMYRDAINLCIQCKKYDKAVDLLLRFGELCSNTNAASSLAKSYLGAVVVQLYIGTARDAWCTYQDCLGVDSFLTSDAAHAADKLFSAYRSGSVEEVKNCVKSDGSFVHSLDNSIARLAKRLPIGDLKKQADELAKASGQAVELTLDGNQDLDEDDLT